MSHVSKTGWLSNRANMSNLTSQIIKPLAAATPSFNFCLYLIVTLLYFAKPLGVRLLLLGKERGYTFTIFIKLIP